MPDVHQGYGFPVGGVAATEPPDGVISPGGVGSTSTAGCGSSPRRSASTSWAVGEPRSSTDLALVPAGAGKRGRLAVRSAELDHVMRRRAGGGAPPLGHPRRPRAHGVQGRLPGADPAQVSERTRARGPRLGTMGSGNHFIEVQAVERPRRSRSRRPGAGRRAGHGLDPFRIAGLRPPDRCTDYVKRMDAALRRYGIVLPDRQLACAPVTSPEGRAYLGAMACAANFAWANRQTMAHRVREAIAAAIGSAAADRTRQVSRRRPQRGEVRAARRPHAVRAPQGSDAGFPRVAGDPGRVPIGRPAPVHPGEHGHGELRPRGTSRLAGPLVRLRVSRGGPADEPLRLVARSPVATFGASWRRRASWFGAPPPAARRGGPVCLQGRRPRGRRRRARRSRRPVARLKPLGVVKG